MKKIMEIVTPTIALGCVAATTVMLAKNKKNMLDIIIEEIETVK